MPVITFTLLVTVGMDLRPVDFRRLRGQPGLVLTGLLLPLLVLPALALVLVRLFQPPEAIGMGLLLVAACPIGGVSNLYSTLARASTALSVTLTGLSCLIAVVTVPLLGAMFQRVADVPLGLTAPLPLLTGQLLILLLIPVSLGMWARERRPDLVERHRAGLQRASLVAIALLLVAIAASDFDRFRIDTPATAPLAATFVAASFAAGWLGGILVRAEPRDRFTLAAEFATRNVAVAAAIAVTLLHRVEFATFATTYLLTEVPLLLLAIAAFRARGQAPAAVAEARP